MSLHYTDDPERDFDRWDMELERRRARRPVCVECGEHIQDETAFCKNDIWTCEKCIEKQRTWIEDYED